MAGVYPVPAFSDNYIWLLENADGTALVVDPGDAEPVNAALSARGLRLSDILITHHHFDHVGGVSALKAKHNCTVYGPQNPAIDNIDHRLGDGDSIVVGDYSFDVLTVPGHTLDHIAYYQPSDDPNTAPLLFCGDTLFAGGCGRIFEGDPIMMHNSLQRLAALPGNAKVFCAHEYTLANLAFAEAADSENSDLLERIRLAKETRAMGEPTVPSTIALELATNPFLRAGSSGTNQGLADAGRAASDSTEVGSFAALRSWKDEF